MTNRLSRLRPTEQFVLVQVDFPHEKKLPDELKEQNGRLARKYKINTYPSVLLLKPDGELIARTGYSPGGAENYIKQLAGLMKTYESLAGLRGATTHGYGARSGETVRPTD